MKDIKAEQTPQNVKVEKYTTEHDLKTSDKFFRWLDSRDSSSLSKHNWFLWWCLICILFVIYRRWDDVQRIFSSLFLS